MAVPVPTRSESRFCVPAAVVFPNTVAIPIPAATTAGSKTISEGVEPIIEAVSTNPIVNRRDPVTITPLNP